jgi:RNA polymerase sigma-70 factor (ECF subfamily)
LLAATEERSPEPACVDPDPLDLVLDQERHELLADLVTRLSTRDRNFVHLYYQSGMEPEDIARTMDISVKTVYTKKHKIRARLVAMAAEQQALAA